MVAAHRVKDLQSVYDQAEGAKEENERSAMAMEETAQRAKEQVCQTLGTTQPVILMASKVLQETRDLSGMLRANASSTSAELLSRLSSLEGKIMEIVSEITDQMPLGQLPGLADMMHRKVLQFIAERDEIIASIEHAFQQKKISSDLRRCGSDIL